MTGPEKFYNCSNKSHDNITKSIKACCNRFTEVVGYECAKRQIFPLTTNHCENCDEFQQK